MMVMTGVTLGCAVRHTTKIEPVQMAPPAKEAQATDLIASLSARNESIRTLTATVDLQPTAGSVYSGVINEYHDVKGFVLIEKPAMLRMIGQAPVVRTNIFDMVSDGEQFRLYLPTKQKFYIGKNVSRRPAKNALENMRPQHILDALLIAPMGEEKYSYEEAEDGGRRYYVLTTLDSSGDHEWTPRRKVWFDRADLEIARLELYGQHGAYLENVLYSDFRDFQGVRFPAHIQIVRPLEDYRLSITIQKATFNEPLGPEKFELKKPDGAQLVDLSAEPVAEGPHGQ